MHGVIEQFDKHRLFGLIDVSRSTRRVFFQLHNVRLDELGRQMSRANNIGSQVEFTLVEGNRPGREQAMDVFPYEPFAEPIDLDAHRELSTLTRWIPEQRIGYAQRESGDWASVSHRDITTLGIESLKVGSQIWHGITFKLWNGKTFDPADPITVPIDPKSVVQCTSIEIIRPSEEQPDEQPVEQPVVEQEQAPAIELPKIDVESSSILLSERFRGKKLRDLGIRKRA